VKEKKNNLSTLKEDDSKTFRDSLVNLVEANKSKKASRFDRNLAHFLGF